MTEIEVTQRAEDLCLVMGLFTTVVHKAVRLNLAPRLVGGPFISQDSPGVLPLTAVPTNAHAVPT